MESGANAKSDPKVVCQKVEVDPKVKPVKRRPKKMALDKGAKVNEEEDHLLSMGFI